MFNKKISIHWRQKIHPNTYALRVILHSKKISKYRTYSSIMYITLPTYCIHHHMVRYKCDKSRKKLVANLTKQNKTSYEGRFYIKN